MEKINVLIEKIGQTVYDNVPIEDWSYVYLEVYMIETYNEITATYFDPNGNKGKSFNPNYPNSPSDQRINNLLINLRENMYSISPSQGAWFSLRMKITEDGDFDIKYNYDEEPNFEMTPENEEYRIDLKKFPREGSLIPDWLKKIVH